jgi:Brp/Blh family beta-carotene 15,15'-monooxygenase
VGLLYLCLGLAYLAVWFSAPSIALLFFLLLTWYHWGQGDLYPFLALTGRTHLRTRTQRALTVVVRGGIPMVVPLLAFPAEYRDVASSVVGLFDPAASLFWLESPLARLVLGVGFALVTVGALAAGRPGRTDPAARASWRLDVRETTLLWVFFLAVPPVVAIGLYFPLWHSLRHLLRVAALDPAGGESTRSRVRSIALDAAPTTAGALVIFGVLALAVPADVGGVESVAAAYLVLLAVLTLPHVVVVTWLDRLQGVWEPR